MQRKKQQGSALRHQNIFNIKKYIVLVLKKLYMYFSVYSKVI